MKQLLVSLLTLLGAFSTYVAHSQAKTFTSIINSDKNVYSGVPDVADIPETTVTIIRLFKSLSGISAEEKWYKSADNKRMKCESGGMTFLYMDGKIVEVREKLAKGKGLVTLEEVQEALSEYGFPKCASVYFYQQPGNDQRIWYEATCGTEKIKLDRSLELML